MQTITILPLVAVNTVWVPVVIPDYTRKSVSFQLESLGVLHYSFDNGTTSMKAVGTGETLEGNFSNQTIYFKSDVVDNLQIRVQDIKEYQR